MKSILFMLINMNIGGTEKAFLNMLKVNENQYDITLIMLERSGGFLEDLPSSVKVIVLEDYLALKKDLNSPPRALIKDYLKQGALKRGLEVLWHTIRGKLAGERSSYYKYLLKKVQPLSETYDLAVAYAGPMDFISYFVINKVKAKKKVQWIHFDVSQIGFNKKFANKIYTKFDRIFTVSKEGRSKLIQLVPTLSDNVEVFRNSLSPEWVKAQSEKGEGFSDDFEGTRILTVGRLGEEKGQDLCIKAMKRLKEEGYSIRWYVVGEGKFRPTCEALIHENHLEEDFILLGSQHNPYPYMKACDLYVQPSRHEGFCITLAEAKCFAKPIVTTCFTGAREQIIDEETGLVVPISAEGIYTGVKRLLDDEQLRTYIQSNLQQTALHDINDWDKLDELLKTQILIAASTMNVGGVEKSLISLLDIMPKEAYAITLLMLEEKGGFLPYVPGWVKKQEATWYKRIKSLLLDSPYTIVKSYWQQKKLWQMIQFVIAYLLTKYTKDRRIYLSMLLHNVPECRRKYDVAISYAGPTELIDSYIVYKVKGAKKIAWIHFDLNKCLVSQKLYKALYKKYHKIFVVSNEARASLVQRFPSTQTKAEVFYNIISKEMINQLAEEAASLDEDYEGTKIMTVGRLSIEKGQDLAIEVTARLKAEGYPIRWYCIGDGKDRKRYEEMIATYGLQEDFILLGAKTNPYAYMNKADLYVQPSRHEGYCLTLAEAKCLNKPIVATDFAGAYEQLEAGKYGIIAKGTKEDLYEKLKLLLDQEALRTEYVARLKKHTLDTSLEVNKLYQCIKS